MKCKYCNADIEQDAQFCPNCGKNLSMFNKCVKCGELLDSDASFCPHCGTEQPHYEEDNVSKKWLWGLCAVLAIGLIAGGFFYFSSNNHEKTTSQEIETEPISGEDAATAMAALRSASEEEMGADSVEVDEDEEILSTPVDDMYTVFGTSGTLKLKKTGYAGDYMSPNTFFGEYGSEDVTMLRFNCYPHSKFGKTDFAELTHCYTLKGPIANVSLMVPSCVDLDGKQYKVNRVTIINNSSSEDHTAGRFVIPSTVEKIKIWGMSALKEVVINEGFEELNERAFRGCPDLESIVFPKSLKRIGKLAFENCTDLKRIHIPASVIDVCEGAAFVGLNKGVTIEVEKGCEALKNLKPTNVVIRGSYGYENYQFNPDDLNIVYVE